MGMTLEGARDRIELVDALRGFALFGILLANILYWSGWSLMTDAQRLALAGDEGVLWQYRFHHLLVDGKFYTVFSLLFGAGFALQLERLSSRGEDGLRLYRRRVLGLLAIGLVHAWLIWDGDILVLYAVLGLLLPMFRLWSGPALLATAAGLVFVVPFAGLALFRALNWAPHEALYAWGLAISAALGADVAPEQTIAWLQRDDLDGWLAWILGGPPFALGFRLETWRIPKVLGIMLLGLWVGRHLAAGRLPGDGRVLRSVLVGGLAVGLPASFAYALTPGLGQADWRSIIGTVPLALAYSAAFALAWPRARRWLGIFVAPGRMALTNYLSQSVIGIVLFYGIGFGLVGRLGPLAVYAVAIAIFAAQSAWSHWWLSHHAQGPAEAAWRWWTYRGIRSAAAPVAVTGRD